MLLYRLPEGTIFDDYAAQVSQPFQEQFDCWFETRRQLEGTAHRPRRAAPGAGINIDTGTPTSVRQISSPVLGLAAVTRMADVSRRTRACTKASSVA